jgi:hypothetical protein
MRRHARQTLCKPQLRKLRGRVRAAITRDHSTAARVFGDGLRDESLSPRTDGDTRFDVGGQGAFVDEESCGVKRGSRTRVR